MISKGWPEKNVLEDPAELETSILIKLRQNVGKNASCVENAIIEESIFFSFLNDCFKTLYFPLVCVFPIVLYFDTCHNLFFIKKKKKVLP